jgi:phosphomannomutase
MDQQQALEAIASAEAAGNLTPPAVANLRLWLTESHFEPYRHEVVQHIADRKWRELDAAFWRVIEFGTGGRRGKMYPIGSNVINDRTIGESAQGLADYVRRQQPVASDHPACAIAYDTRHRSREFAELCAGIMVAAGFKVYFLDDYRSTPELSFLVRHRCCQCGIMVTASHNPPSDNAVKVYWSTGGQVLPPHDAKIIEHVMSVREIEQVDFATGLQRGDIEICTQETDTAYFSAVVSQSLNTARDIKILYSPLHGVGASAVAPILSQAGFDQVEVSPLHAEPDGDFPNVPEHVSNPENPRVFDALIDAARSNGQDIVLATDPDCDRMGCAAPLSLDTSGEWSTFTGNQLGVLLADYVLQQRQSTGTLTSNSYVIKTLVTTEMIRRVADSYGVRTCGNLLVGFKWIGGLIDDQGPEEFVFGAEESHGYLVGQYARDKDGPVACLLMAELAAQLKAAGKSLHEKLDDLYWQHGLHLERLFTLKMEGSEGMAAMERLMTRFRERPPTHFGAIPVQAVRDYLNLRVIEAGQSSDLDGPRGNMVMLDLSAPGNYVAVRPSGTEPKVKFYMFAYTPAEQLADLEDTKTELVHRLDEFERQIQALASE